MPKEQLAALPGHSEDIEKSRAQARELMKKAGYGPDKPLKIKVSTRNIAIYRDPAVILIDQLKEVYFDGELDLVDTAVWYTKIARKDYAIGLNTTGNGVDDPDQNFFENFACKSERNYTNYCNADIEKLTFERAIEELETIVKRLEEGKVPLEESVAIYERGEALKRWEVPPPCRTTSGED